MIGNPLNRCFIALGFLYQADNLRQYRLTANPGRTDHQPTGPVYCRSGDSGTRFLIDRNRLSADHCLVDGGDSLDHLTINRNLLPRSDQQQVPRLHIAGRNFPLLPIAEQYCPVRLQLQQPFQRSPRLAFGPRLQPLAETDKEDQHGAGFKKYCGPLSEEPENRQQ